VKLQLARLHTADGRPWQDFLAEQDRERRSGGIDDWRRTVCLDMAAFAVPHAEEGQPGQLRSVCHHHAAPSQKTLMKLVLRLTPGTHLEHDWNEGDRTAELSLPFRALRKVCDQEKVMAVGESLRTNSLIERRLSRQ
jgi:hypothetical protein